MNFLERVTGLLRRGGCRDYLDFKKIQCFEGELDTYPWEYLVVFAFIVVVTALELKSPVLWVHSRVLRKFKRATILNKEEEVDDEKLKKLDNTIGSSPLEDRELIKLKDRLYYRFLEKSKGRHSRISRYYQDIFTLFWISLDLIRLYVSHRNMTVPSKDEINLAVILSTSEILSAFRIKLYIGSTVVLGAWPLRFPKSKKKEKGSVVVVFVLGMLILLPLLHGLAIYAIYWELICIPPHVKAFARVTASVIAGLLFLEFFFDKFIESDVSDIAIEMYKNDGKLRKSSRSIKRYKEFQKSVHHRPRFRRPKLLSTMKLFLTLLFIVMDLLGSESSIWEESDGQLVFGCKELAFDLVLESLVRITMLLV